MPRQRIPPNLFVMSTQPHDADCGNKPQEGTTVVAGGMVMSKWDVSQSAEWLHAEALVWDAHAGFESVPDADLSELRRWRDSGVDYLSINAGYDVRPWENTIAVLGAYRFWLAAHADDYLMAETVDDVRRAKAEGKMAVTFDIEGMNALNGDLGMVELYHRLGVRQMLFAYNLNNAAGGGCHDVDTGLTPFGRDVVGEMNRVGMLVDCSHSAYRTTLEAMEVSEVPVVFSHSNARALCDHERNIRDEQIKACAATGGVVGINGIGFFLAGNRPDVEAMLHNLQYMRDLVGAAHLGLGLDCSFHQEDLTELLTGHSDFWPSSQYAGDNPGFVAVESLPRLTELMLTGGFTEDEVRGILGGNFLRIAAQVWRPAIV